MNLKAAFNAEFLAAMADLYREVDADIAGRQGVCVASGRCCRFEEYGHRLYVTHAELIYFYAVYMRPPAHHAGDGVGVGPDVPPRSGGFPLSLYHGDGEFAPGCPWQVQGLCTARNGRPWGCRIYFCDSGSRSWQGTVYEQWHRQFADMHERFGFDYGYVEWRQGLALVMSEELSLLE